MSDPTKQWGDDPDEPSLEGMIEEAMQDVASGRIYDIEALYEALFDDDYDGDEGDE